MSTYSTTPFNNQQTFMQNLKQSGFKVEEKNGNVYVDFGNGEKYKVDLSKPAWFILTEIEQAKKKSEVKNSIKKWADFNKEIYKEKTEENKVLSKIMAYLRYKIHETENKLNPILEKYKVDEAEEITNTDDRYYAIKLSNNNNNDEKRLNRIDMEFMGNCYTALDAALHAGNWETQALLCDC